MHTVKERGPSCRVTVPGSQLGPGLKFLTITLSPTSTVLTLTRLSWSVFCCDCFSHTLLFMSGLIKSNLVPSVLPRNKLAGDTPVVEWGEDRYVNRKLANRCGSGRPSFSLASIAFLKV